MGCGTPTLSLRALSVKAVKCTPPQRSGRGPPAPRQSYHVFGISDVHLKFLLPLPYPPGQWELYTECSLGALLTPPQNFWV